MKEVLISSGPFEATKKKHSVHIRTTYLCLFKLVGAQNVNVSELEFYWKVF